MEDVVYALQVARYTVVAILIGVIATFAYLAISWDLSFFVVPSESMEPTLLIGDQLATLRADTYKRGDIVVLHDPMESGGYVVKRIVGMPGDTVRVEYCTLFVNDVPLEEPYTREPMDYNMASYTVPEEHIYVLGDNRNNSDDCHAWGHAVPSQSVVGKLRYVYLPVDRQGAPKEYPSVFEGV